MSSLDAKDGRYFGPHIPELLINVSGVQFCFFCTQCIFCYANELILQAKDVAVVSWDVSWKVFAVLSCDMVSYVYRLWLEFALLERYLEFPLVEPLTIFCDVSVEWYWYWLNARANSACLLVDSGWILGVGGFTPLVKYSPLLCEFSANNDCASSENTPYWIICVTDFVTVS